MLAAEELHVLAAFGEAWRAPEARRRAARSRLNGARLNGANQRLTVGAGWERLRFAFEIAGKTSTRRGVRG